MVFYGSFEYISFFIMLTVNYIGGITMESCQVLVNVVKNVRDELDARIERMVDKYIEEAANILKKSLNEAPQWVSQPYFAVPLGNINLKEGSFTVKTDFTTAPDEEELYDRWEDLMSEEKEGDYPGYEKYVGIELKPLYQALKNRGFYYIGTNGDDDRFSIYPFFKG